jgi:hypothetical protein
MLRGLRISIPTEIFLLTYNSLFSIFSPFQSEFSNLIEEFDNLISVPLSAQANRIRGTGAVHSSKEGRQGGISQVVKVGSKESWQEEIKKRPQRKEKQS